MRLEWWFETLNGGGYRTTHLGVRSIFLHFLLITRYFVVCVCHGDFLLMGFTRTYNDK